MMQSRSPAHHRANRLLAALDVDDLARLELHLEAVQLAAGRVLYESGETVRHAYFPHGCVVSLLAVLEDGGSAEVALFGCEGVLGYASSLFSREAFGRYVVQVPGSASRVPLARLHEAVDASPALRDLLQRCTEALLMQTFQIVACNAIHAVEARCCRWILSTQDRVKQVDLPLTHEFLAEMLGVQRSTVSLVVRALQTAGLIRQGRGVISVSDRAGLEESACECYGVIRRNFERLLSQTDADR